MLKELLEYNFKRIHWKSVESDIVNVNPQIAARMLFYINVIREFEELILALKNDGCVWGPVHSSVGQEAIAAGSVATLRPSDKFFGTHRSHHIFLAKTLQYYIPNNWNPLTQGLPSVATEAVRKTLAEIMGLSDGYCGGRGGSMHLRCKEAGFVGSNAIVGGGIPLATGAAFAEKYNKTGNVVVCFFGDGAINQGVFHEACNLAGLWGLPIIFFLENNKYAVGTKVAESCAISDLSVRAASYGMDAHTVDGNDVLAIFQLFNSVKRSGCYY